MTKLLGLCLLVVPAAGCAGNPLVGRWNASFNNNTGMGTATGTASAELRGDGTATYTVTLNSVSAGPVQGTCTGSLMYTGLMWSSTATVLTVTGPGTCSGSSTCTFGVFSYTFDCAAAMSSGSSLVGTYDYTLTNNNMSLTVTPTGGGSSTTFMRGS